MAYRKTNQPTLRNHSVNVRCHEAAWLPVSFLFLIEEDDSTTQQQVSVIFSNSLYNTPFISHQIRNNNIFLKKVKLCCCSYYLLKLCWYLSELSSSQAFVYLFTFFHFHSVVRWNSEIHKIPSCCFFSFFILLINTRSGLLAEIVLSVRIPKSQRILFVSFSSTDSGLCMYHLIAESNFNLLHISQWITFSTQSRLVLYSFCVGLLHLLIMWLTISCLSLHTLHMLFFCVLSIFAWYNHSS